MSYDIIYVFSVLAVAIVLFISDRIRLDVVAVLVILALSLGGILTPREAVSGFGEPIVLMIAALFIVGEGMFHTGIAFSIGDIIV
ncbi:MAG: sodium:solute symporter, partial [Rhodospirillales bacterium]|nr:sodium:solute symporter [Rhodospirillales bacterium]